MTTCWSGGGNLAGNS